MAQQELELRGKDGKLYGKLKDGRYLEMKKGSHTEVFDLQKEMKNDNQKHGNLTDS